MNAGRLRRATLTALVLVWTCQAASGCSARRAFYKKQDQKPGLYVPKAGAQEQSEAIRNVMPEHHWGW
jgi:hypothetical protein